MTEYQIPLIASSNPINGATQVSQNGSRFTIVYTRPLIVPAEATYCWITVENSTIIFNTPNILEGVNDKLLVRFEDGVNPILEYDITIGAGLYDLDHLNSAISQQLSNLGALSDAVSLIPDTATQKVVVKFREHYQIDFTIANNFAEILGFEEREVPEVPAIIDNQYENSDNIAKFNTILYYLMHSDLVSGHGIRIGSNYADILQQVPITVSAGSQISYEPQNLQIIPCPNLVGQSLREVHYWLTDDQNRFVDTLGEFWSVRLNIHYKM